MLLNKFIDYISYIEKLLFHTKKAKRSASANVNIEETSKFKNSIELE